MKGWNLDGAELTLPPHGRRAGHLSGSPPTRRDSFPTACPSRWTRCPEMLRTRSPTTTWPHAQKVTLPMIVNGRIDRPGRLGRVPVRGPCGRYGRRGGHARRLDSPLDSVLKTHRRRPAKCWPSTTTTKTSEAGDEHALCRFLPDGSSCPRTATYYVHLGDIARNGGEEYAYRLRISSAAARFRLAGRALQRRAAQQGCGRAHGLCYSQGRVQRPDQAELEGPAGRILGAARLPLGEAAHGAAGGENHPCGCEAAGQPHHRRPARKLENAKWSTRPCPRKTGCRPSCGGISFPQRI